MWQTTALKQNLISGESCNHQTCSKGKVFFPINDYLISHLYVNFRPFKGQKLHVIQQSNNAWEDKKLFNLTVT